MRSAQAQVGLLAALGTGQHAPGIGSEECRHQDRGQAEEDEHPLADRGVGLRDDERVRDVVDEVVLTGRDPRDRAGDRPCLRERRGRARVQALARDEHVDLLDRKRLDHASELCTAGPERGDDRAREDRRADDDGVAHVEEVLEVARPPAREQRVGASEVGDAADRQRERAAGREPQLDRRSRPHPERPRRLGADQRGARAEPAGRDPDRRVVVAVAAIEGEDPYRVAHDGASGAQRSGGKIDERESVGRGHGRDRGDPRAHLLERPLPRAVGGNRHEALPARDARPQPQRPRGHGSPGARRVGDRRGRRRSDRPDVAAQPGETRRERAPAGLVRKPRPVQPRRSRDVAKWRRRLFHDDDVVRGLGSAVDHPERDGHGLSGRDRAGRAEPFLQPQIAAHGRGEHALHVESERSDRPCRQGRPRTVDEEEHRGEQADSERHARRRSERTARVAHELAPDVATHGRRARLRQRRRPRSARHASGAAHRAARPARGHG